MISDFGKANVWENGGRQNRIHRRRAAKTEDSIRRARRRRHHRQRYIAGLVAFAAI